MATYYVATNGSDSRTAAQAQSISTPWLTIQKGVDALTNAGDKLEIRGGTYAPTIASSPTNGDGTYNCVIINHKNGAEGNPIVIENYNGEEVILSGVNNHGSAEKWGIKVVNSSYVAIKGIYITRVLEHVPSYPATYPAYPMGGGDVHHIYIERCTAHQCGTGFGFGGDSDYIYFKNCDAIDNCDIYPGTGGDDFGGFANGFSNNLNDGMHMFYDGCRAWLNSDDGWDCFGSHGYIYYHNCWAFENGHTSDPTGTNGWRGGLGDGQGFKVGCPTQPPVHENGQQRILVNCLAFENDQCGFDESEDYNNLDGDGNPGPWMHKTLYNCVAYNNANTGFAFYNDLGGIGIVTLKNCISYSNNQAEVAIRTNLNSQGLPGSVQNNNSWQIASLTDSDFSGLSTAAAKGARLADGSLPVLPLLHLSSTATDLIWTGTNLGSTIDFDGNSIDLTKDAVGTNRHTPPSLGAYEYGSSSSIPSLTTTAVTSITTTTAVSGGNISSDGGASVTARGVCWSTTSNPTTANSKTIDGTGIGSFTSNITGLTQGTIYHVRAYATNNVGTAYGSDIQFITSTPVVIPTVTTVGIGSITTTTFTSGGTITNTGGGTITAKGICWGTTTSPTISGSHTSDGSGSSSWASLGTGISQNITYYVRAYATNSAGTGYGNELQFVSIATVPNMTTVVVSSITATTATGGNTVVDDGGASISVRGVCWSTSINPTIANTHTSDLPGAYPNTIADNITSLTPNTLYYVRAYATNLVGTGYGNQVSFTTTASIPSVGMDQLYNVTSTTVQASGMVIDEGGSSVITKGACWSTVTNPTIADSKTVLSGSGTGMFSSTLSGLTPNTLYYVRIYATNSVGTGYSANYTITTLAEVTFCSIIKAQVKRWMCFPTFLSGHGLLYNWYAVSYNTGGASIAPTGWHIPTVEEITTLQTYLGGFSTSGGKLKESGYSHWASPNTGATNESGFTSLPSGMRSPVEGTYSSMSLETRYWVNTLISEGIASQCILYYSNENFVSGGSGPFPTGCSIRFIKDNSTVADCIDYDGNNYGGVQIGTQVWTTKNFKGAHYNNGTPIPEITDNTLWINDTLGARCYYNNDNQYA